MGRRRSFAIAQDDNREAVILSAVKNLSWPARRSFAIAQDDNREAVILSAAKDLKSVIYNGYK